jgi:FkbM family methyltransferase
MPVRVAGRVGRRLPLPGRRATARDRRRSFFRRAGAFTPLIGVTTEGGVFVVSTGDEFGEGLFVKGSRSDLIALGRAVQVLGDEGRSFVGTTFVDIGAHIGTTSVTALRLHGFARAIAVEPNPQNRRLLRINLVLNDVEDAVTVFPIAVGDHDERTSLQIDSVRSGGSRVAVTDGVETAVPVSVTTVDHLAEGEEVDPAAIGLLWIDAQGHEARVVRGASTLVGQGLPFVTAVRPRKLAEDPLGGSLVETIREHYTHVVDLRAPNLKSPWTPAIRPAAEIERLASAAKNTDVLAFRRR